MKVAAADPTVTATPMTMTSQREGATRSRPRGAFSFREAAQTARLTAGAQPPPLIHLPLAAAAAFGLALVLGHNLLDGITPAQLGRSPRSEPAWWLSYL